LCFSSFLRADTPPPQNISVKADNITSVGGITITLGQKTSALSWPVVLPSDQLWATSTLQTTANNSLTSIATNTLNTSNYLSGISVISTAALQTTENGILTQIANNTASALTDVTNSGNITSACTVASSCAASSFVNVASQGQYTVGISVTGTFVAAYLVEGQNADSTWTTLPMFITQAGVVPYPVSNALAGAAQVIVIGGAYQNIRVRCYSYTSGTISTAIDASIAQQAVLSAQLGPWYMQGNVASGTTDSGNGIKVAGVAQAQYALPSFTTGQRSDHPTDLKGRQYAAPDSGKATYSAAFTGATSGIAATDVFTIFGSASKKVVITRIGFSGTITTAAYISTIVNKKTAVNVGGISSAVAITPHDSTSATATATVLSYTVNPTTIGAASALRSIKWFIPATGTGQIQNEPEFQFNTSGDKGIVLNSATEGVSINMNGSSLTGNSMSYFVEWTEE